MPRLGTIENLEPDRDGRERKRRLEAIALCDCGAEVELWAETEAWDDSAAEPGVCRHAEFGCPMGVCEPCGLLYVDNFGAAECYDLRKPVEIAQ